MFNALVIEDDIRYVENTLNRILNDYNFAYVHKTDSKSAIEYLNKNDLGHIDLFIVDRRIPEEAGGTLSDGNGDSIVSALIDSQKYPSKSNGSLIISLTGYADIGQSNRFNRDSDFLYRKDSQDFNIKNLILVQKENFFELKEILKKYSTLLKSIDNIALSVERADVLNTEIGLSDLYRSLKSYAYYKEAVSIDAKAVSGGLSNSTVWSCDITGSNNAKYNYYIKISSKNSGDTADFQNSIDRKFIAATLEKYSYLTNGLNLSIIQPAGTNVRPLATCLIDQYEESMYRLQCLIDELRDKPSSIVTKLFSEFSQPIIKYDKVTELSKKYNIPLIDKDKNITFRAAPRHGDLHIFNILNAGSDLVVIDFDSSVIHSFYLDVVTLALSALSHIDTPFKNEPFEGQDEIENFFSSELTTENPVSLFISEIFRNYVINRNVEFWAVVYCYSLRQLQYKDVVNDLNKFQRFVGIANLAASRIH